MKSELVVSPAPTPIGFVKLAERGVMMWGLDDINEGSEAPLFSLRLGCKLIIGV